MANEVDPLHPPRPLVLSIHGINTRGAWQKESLTLELNKAGFDHAPLDFGTFRTFWLLLKWTRNTQIKWFREKYTRLAADKVPSIIAHSFGTYLVARSMQKYGEIKFDRIIFCGSIVQPQYPWSVRFQNGQFNALLNDFGKKDLPVKLSEWGVIDAGPSGAIGFTDACEAITQRAHPEFGHSDYFYELNYTKNWIPFLRGEQPQAIAASDIPAHNTKFWITLILGVLVLVLATCLLWFYLIRESPPQRSNATISEFMEKRESISSEALERDYVGKEVEWEGYVVSASPSADPPFYTLKPNETSPLKEWVSAPVAAKDYRHSILPGDQLRVRGVIKRIGPSLTELRDCKVID